jgi:hypothetical protein
MTKTAALNSKGLVVRDRRKPPVKPRGPGEYHEFDQYWNAARSLARTGDAIFDQKRKQPIDVGDLKPAFLHFARERDHFERGELYRLRKSPRADLLGFSQNYELTRSAVGEACAALIGSFYSSAWASQDQESFIAFLVEEIIAANPRASVLEATARTLRRTWKQSRPPPIAEVLDVLQQQARQWDDVLSLHRSDMAYWKRVAKQSNPDESSSDDHA